MSSLVERDKVSEEERSPDERYIRVRGITSTMQPIQNCRLNLLPL